MSVLLGPNPLCFEGSPYFLDVCDTTDPGNTKTIFSFTVPALTTRKLKQLWVTTTSDGDFELEVGGVVVASGRLHATEKNILFKFDPPRPISAGTLVELKFITDALPSSACPICVFLSGSDFT